LKDIWPLAALVPLVCGSLITLGCGGAALRKRIIAAAVGGAAIGLLYTVVSAIPGHGVPAPVGKIAAGCFWRVFVFAIFSTVGAVATELKLPEPQLQ
jgi:hypothetical protein